MSLQEERGSLLAFCCIIDDMLSLHQESFLLQHIRTNTETQSDIMQKARGSEHLALREGMSIKSLPLYQDPRSPAEKEAGRGKSQRAWKPARGHGCLHSNHQSTYECTETEDTCTVPALVCTRSSVYLKWLP